MKKAVFLATAILLFLLTTVMCVSAAPADEELYNETYGELIYFEDFEDSSTANAYATMGGEALIWTEGTVVDNPVGEGKAFISTVSYLQFKITGPRTIASTEVTLSVDLLNYDSATSNIPVAFLNSWLDPWNYWTNGQISKTEWTTKSVTITKNVTLDSGNLFFYFGGKGMYFDNIKVYAKYDLGNNVRLFDDGIVISEVTGNTFTFPDFKTATKNCWVDSEGTQYFAGDVVNAADCMGKTYYSKAIDFVEVEEVLKLNLSAQAITTDKGTVTIIPEISYINGRAETNFSDITYTIDTVNATINRNADHSITVTGQINGDVTITAHFPERIRNKLKNHDESIETTITISGQPERIVSSTFKVMMFGNSIRKHPPNESLKWTGNWGMAASSEDKDYAHRFIYYMNEKYGQGVAVLYNTSSVDSFESAFANKDETADYTESVSTYIKQIKEVNPDIITLQFGDNAKNVTSTAAYKNGTMQFIREIRKVAPDAIIVLSTPFFGGGYHIDGTIAAGEEADVPVALLHKLYTYENWAKSENPDLAAGVGIHPGDRGMDNIAKMFFELADIEIAERNCLEYSTIPTSIEIEGENFAITTADGVLNLSAKILPADAPQDVIWTLVSENHGRFATLDANGKLSAVNNGTVTVRATSRYVESLYDEVTVTISGQTAPFTVTYNGNASDATVPAPNTWAKKGFRLDNPEAFASRPGYKFVGWALSADGEVVDSLENATTDTTVYAKWTIADSWDFEREGYIEDFTFENAFHLKVLEGYLTATATDTSDVNILKIKSPTLMLNSADYSLMKIKMRNTEKASDTTLKLTVTSGGTKTEFTKAVTSVDYVDYRFDLSALSGTITGFEITPTNVDCTLYVESIEFVKKGVGEYTAKPASFSESYGNLVYFDNFSGNDFGNTADIVVLGPGSKNAIILGKYAALNDANTLSAYGGGVMSGLLIKAADGETFKYNDGRVMNGTFNFEFEIYNGTASNVKFYYCVNKNPGGWEGWANLYTAWGGVTVTAGTWATRSTAFDPKYATVAYLNSAKLGENVAIASVAVYFKPKNAATLIVGDNTTLIDLNELEQYTLPVVEGYNKYIDAEKNVYDAGQTYAAADIIGKTFTAEYVEIETVQYTVSFHDSTFNSQIIEEGECATNPGSVNKPGYTFLYWSLTENGSEYNFNTPVTSNITLYAVYEKIEQTESVYTSKPAVFSENYGNLVYFDNFSGEDFGNVADIIVVGPGSKSAVFLGKNARLNDGTALGHAQMSGLLIKAANGESFKYNDGRNMNGTFYLSYEVYNNATKECGFFYCRDINTGGWSSWAGLYTAWHKKVSTAGTWTTISTTESSTGKAIFGYLNAESFGESTAIASVSLYFMPNNKATFIVDGNKTIMDLEGLTTITMPAPGEDFNAWTDGNGNVYAAGQTVNVVNIKNVTLTAFATDPYSIDSISLLDEDFNAITTIPDKSFFVEVEVTNVSYDKKAIVLIATYDNDGRMIDIDFLYANPSKGQSVTFGAQVNNKAGNVAKVKAFIIDDLKKFDALTEAVEITKSN